MKSENMAAHPFSPLLINFWTSFTPLRMFFTLAAGKTEKIIKTLIRTSVQHQSSSWSQQQKNFLFLKLYYWLRKHGTKCCFSLLPAGGRTSASIHENVFWQHKEASCKETAYQYKQQIFQWWDVCRINLKSPTITERSHFTTYDVCNV